MIACPAPMPWMFSVFEVEFVPANNAGPRKNQATEIPIRLIVVEIFNLCSCNVAAQNRIQHHLRLRHHVDEEPVGPVLFGRAIRGACSMPIRPTASQTQKPGRPNQIEATFKK